MWRVLGAQENLYFVPVVAPSATFQSQNATCGIVSAARCRPRMGFARICKQELCSKIASARYQTPCSTRQSMSSIFAHRCAVQGNSRRRALISMRNAQLTAPLESHDQHDASTPGQPPLPLHKTRRVGLLGVAIGLFTFLWAVPIFSFMVLTHPLVLLFDKKRRRLHDWIAILWAKATFASVGIIPKVYGQENLPPPGTPVVFAANHQSYTDIFSMAWLNRTMKFVAKSEILRLPTIGWAIALGRHVVLRRGDRRGHVEAYKAMLQVLRNGNALAIFPEGTRSQTGAMRKFQPGAFKASVSTGAPIVPITIRGTRELMPPGALLPIKLPADGVSLVVHPMIFPDGKTDRELSDDAFSAIMSGLPLELQHVET